MASHATLNGGYAVPLIRKRPEYDILHFISSAVSPIEAVGRGANRRGGNCWEILMQLLSDNSNSHILVYLCTNSVLLQLKLLHTITSDSKPIAHLPICMFAHLHTTTFAHTLAHQHRTIWSPVGLIQLQQETRSGRVFTLKSTEKRSPALLTATMTLLMMIWLSVNEWP